MKILQNVLAVVVLFLVAAIAFQYFNSGSLDSRLGSTERQVLETKGRIELVALDARTQGEAVKKHAQEIAAHSESLGTQGREIADLKTRVTAVEMKIADLSKSAETDRGQIDRHRSEIEKLRGDLDAMLAQKEDLEKRKKELDELRRELKKSLERSNDLEKNSTELERRLLVIEKQLGIERPQP